MGDGGELGYVQDFTLGDRIELLHAALFLISPRPFMGRATYRPSGGDHA